MDPLATLGGYHPSGDAERAAWPRVEQLLASGDPWDRSRPLHLTASALVFDATSARVLLRWHRHLRRWLQVGGHGDPGERDPWQVALREAREETGLDDLAALEPGSRARPVHVAVVPVPARAGEAAHEHADIRYLLATHRPQEARPESPGAPLRWLTVVEAEREAEDDNLTELLKRAEAVLGARG